MITSEDAFEYYMRAYTELLSIGENLHAYFAYMFAMNAQQGILDDMELEGYRRKLGVLK